MPMPVVQFIEKLTDFISGGQLGRKGGEESLPMETKSQALLAGL
jgi:hypothetical protein